MQIVDSMGKACVLGAPVGRMGRLRLPAAPVRLGLVVSLVLLFFLQNMRLGSSLDSADVASEIYGEGIDIDTLKSMSRCYTEEGGDAHSAACIRSWNGRRENIRMLTQTSSPPNLDPTSSEKSSGPNSPPSPSPSHSPPLSPSSPSHSPPPPPPPPPDPSRKWFLILVPVLVVVVVLALVLAVYIRRKDMKVVKPWKTGLSGQLQKALITGVPQLKRSEVETACESFSNIIGTLSDATVYKGTLSSGVEIAVSVIKANKHWPPQYKTQFKKKIAMLSRVNHKNFVNLIGTCEESIPFTRMLIFEYAPNGTLFEHLHIRESQDLSWQSRLRIAMGVAYCLEYMHQLNPAVILKNLDSNVIYLTDDFAAKIADMELWSKTTEGGAVIRSSEALQHEMPDKESLVHKFGIVLLELLSGRPPYSDENFGLVSWASDYLKGGKPLKEMIDPVLSKVCEEDVKPFFEVVRSCLNPNPRERPSMSEVATRLKGMTGVTPEGAAPKLSPLWWAELEIISSEAT